MPAGIGSQTQALKNLNIEHKVVGISEIDKYAIQSYEAIHGPVNNFGDISKIDKLPYADLWTYSFPCQDISISGSQKGFIKDSGTRSGLLWEVERLLKASDKPKYLLMENVKNLLSKRFERDFKEWIIQLDKLGYNSCYKVLNSKDYGIPQNRERVFMVSIRKDIKQKYVFPKKQKLKLRLKDMLEDKVDKKYYLSEELINYFTKHKKIHSEKGNGFTFEPAEDTNCTSKTITSKAGSRATDNYIKEPVICASRGRNPDNLSDRTIGAETQQRLEINSQGTSNTLTTVQKDNLVLYVDKYKNGGICGYDYSTNREQEQRIWSENGNIPCLQSSNKEVLKIDTDYRIRKLTPLECYRLQGFTDVAFYKAKNSGVSDTQLYRQAGNSITVQVLEAIFKELFITKTQPLTLF